MKRKNLTYPVLSILIALIFSTWSLNGQSTCSPILVYDNSYNLCTETGSLDLTVSVGLPAGCAHSNSITPYNYLGPNMPGEIDDNQVSISTPLAGDYSVQVNLINAPSETCPCLGVHTSNIITINQGVDEPQVSNDSNTAIFCGESTTLVAVANSSSSSGGTFNWYDSSDNLIYTGASFETGVLDQDLNLSVTHLVNGCESSPFEVDVIVNELPSPTVTMDTEISIYCGNNITLEAQAPPFNIHWYADAALTQLLHIGNQYISTDLEFGTENFYAVTTNGVCQSSNVEIFTINIGVPSPPIANDFTTCAGNGVVLAVSGTNVGQVESFEWYNDLNVLQFAGVQYQLPSFITDNQGTYNYKVYTVVDGCRSPSFANQSVTVLSLPELEPPSPLEVTICEGESFTLTASVTDGSATYFWVSPIGETSESQTGEITISESNLNYHEGIWSVVAVTNDGCQSDQAFSIVIINPRPTIGILPEYSFTDGSNVQLFASGGISYDWSPSEYLDDASIQNPTVVSHPEVEPNDSVIIDFDVLVFDGFCEDTASTIVKIFPWTESPVVYDVITPNGDDKNDTWRIDYLYNLEDYVIYVFDEQSQLVFFHNSSDSEYNETNYWDARVNSDNYIATGVYRYVIESSNSPAIKGMLTILTD